MLPSVAEDLLTDRYSGVGIVAEDSDDTKPVEESVLGGRVTVSLKEVGALRIAALIVRRQERVLVSKGECMDDESRSVRVPDEKGRLLQAVLLMAQ